MTMRCYDISYGHCHLPGGSQLPLNILWVLILIDLHLTSFRTDKVTMVDTYQYPDKNDLFEREPFGVRFSSSLTGI